MTPRLTIITGAQTGVGTAAIKAAQYLRLPYKGWVPYGLTNESGLIPDQYRKGLRETPSHDNAQRTEWNAREADSVLTVLQGPREKAMGDTKWGVEVSTQAGKPMCFVNLQGDWTAEIAKVRSWLRETGPRTCMVGGPRESEEPGIEDEATRFLAEALKDS